MAAGESRKPAIAQILRGAGLADHDDIARQHAARRASGTALDHLLQHLIHFKDHLRVGNRGELQGKRLERRSGCAQYRTHGAQRHAIAAVGKPRIQLRHLERCGIDRTQEQRRHLRRRALQAKALQGLRNVGHADVHSDCDGCEVHGLGERAHQRHGAIDLAREIERAPVRAVRHADVDRRILHDARGGVAVGLERRQINERFDH